MVAMDPADRWDMAKVQNSAWMQAETASAE